MKVADDIREKAKLVREAGDILDEIADNMEDKTISEEDREMKHGGLMYLFAKKINSVTYNF